MEVIWVAKPTRVEESEALREITAYLYAGWEYSHYGTGVGPFAGMGGFFFVRVSDASGPGFGIGPLRDRLASGLYDVSDHGTATNADRIRELNASLRAPYGAFPDER